MTRRPAFAFCTVSAIVATAPRAWAWGLPDDGQMALVREANPHAAELLDRGEGLAGAGAFREAEALFRQAVEEFPDNALPWRRDCEALVELGDRKAAIRACARALETRRSPVSVLAAVHALVGGPARPETLDVFTALQLADREERKAPGSFTAEIARCDVALSIGDGIMLQRCAAELEKSIPNEPILRRAHARLAERCPPWRFWAGWLTVCGALAMTLWHALLRRAGRLRRSAAAAIACFALLAIPDAARADTPAPAESSAAPRVLDVPALEKEGATHHLSRFPVDLQNPEQHIPSIAERNAEPMQFGYWLQDVAATGLLESRLGDHAGAVKFFSALAQVVPEQATAFVHLCKEYEALGDVPKAINACGDVLMRAGAHVNDYMHFVTLVLSQPGDLSAKEIAALQNVVKFMKEDPASHDVASEVECQVATRTSNVAQLTECVAVLSKQSPDDAKTLSYAWALAVEKGHFDAAADLLARLKTAGVPQETIDRMEKRIAFRRTRWIEKAALVLVAVAGLIAGLVLAMRYVRRRRRDVPSADAPIAA